MTYSVVAFNNVLHTILQDYLRTVTQLTKGKTVQDQCLCLRLHTMVGQFVTFHSLLIYIYIDLILQVQIYFSIFVFTDNVKFSLGAAHYKQLRSSDQQLICFNFSTKAINISRSVKLTKSPTGIQSQYLILCCRTNIFEQF